jgi:hypothetical protein
MRPLLGYVCLGAALGCGDMAFAPGTEALVGQWQAATALLQPRGSVDRLLVITADGRSESHTIDRGLYEGQAPADLAAEIVLYGHIRVRGNYFRVEPDSEVTHDLFYGPNHRAVQRDFAGWPRDSTRFEVRGSKLTLEFYAYPFDAPVLTQQTFTRVP